MSDLWIGLTSTLAASLVAYVLGRANGSRCICVTCKTNRRRKS